MKKIIKYLTVVVLAIAVFEGCKKDNYIVGGQLESTVTPLSTYDYLKNNRFNMFDTLLLLVDKAGIKNVINQQGITFYAPTDFSINNYLTIRRNQVRNHNPNKNYTIDTLIKYDLQGFKDSINMYIIPKTITYNSLSQNGVVFNTAFANKQAVISFETTTDVTLGYTSAVSTPPRLEFYTYIKSGPLPSPLIASDISPSVGVRVLCQTSGLTTATGQLNVLVNTHTLYFKNN